MSKLLSKILDLVREDYKIEFGDDYISNAYLLIKMSKEHQYVFRSMYFKNLEQLSDVEEYICLTIDILKDQLDYRIECSMSEENK